MFRTFFIILLLKLITPQDVIAQQEITENYVLNYLKETKYALYKAIEGLPQEEWNYRPKDSGWTIGEIAEHIVEAEKTIYHKLKYELLTEENKKGVNSNFEEADKEILKLTTDRSRKLNAPEAIQPKGRWETPEDFLVYFEGIRNRTMEFVQNSKVDFRLYSVYFLPLGKDMDGYEWLLIIPSHTQRHLAQIAENREEFANGTKQ